MPGTFLQLLSPDLHHLMHFDLDLLMRERLASFPHLCMPPGTARPPACNNFLATCSSLARCWRTWIPRILISCEMLLHDAGET